MSEIVCQVKYVINSRKWAVTHFKEGTRLRNKQFQFQVPGLSISSFLNVWFLELKSGNKT